MHLTKWLTMFLKVKFSYLCHYTDYKWNSCLNIFGQHVRIYFTILYTLSLYYLETQLEFPNLIQTARFSNGNISPFRIKKEHTNWHYKSVFIILSVFFIYKYNEISCKIWTILSLSRGKCLFDARSHDFILLPRQPIKFQYSFSTWKKALFIG